MLSFPYVYILRLNKVPFRNGQRGAYKSGEKCLALDLQCADGHHADCRQLVTAYAERQRRTPDGRVRGMCVNILDMKTNYCQDVT